MTPGVALVMGLDDPGAVLAVAGGKGASLARLARAGLPVPAGFHVTTRAYLEFAAQDGLGDRVTAALAGVDASDPGTFETAAGRVGELFAGQPVPADVAAAIAEGYAGLGDDVAVAVRSSATTEDQPGMSFAGQHATYLNVRGRDGVLDAVRQCWASLWTARAIGYRARHQVTAGAASMAVVVQRFVPADAAGVLFTVNPVAGGGDQVVINAGWGLGETVVGGQATPDTVVVDRASGRVADYRIGGKEVMAVPASTGTREQATPAGRRAAAVLSDDEASELARTGLAVEKLYGQPVDIEWARAGGTLVLLQARPVTGLEQAGQPGGRADDRSDGNGDVKKENTPGIQRGEEWNDSLSGDYLWINGNLGEAIPDVMTPATWSFVELFMTRMISPPHVPGYYGYGRVGGRFYVNFSMAVELSALGGLPRKRFIALTEPVFGKLPPGVQVPRPRLPRLKVIGLSIRFALASLRRLNKAYKRLAEYVASNPGRCDALRADIRRTGQPAELADLWRSRVGPLLLEGSDMLAAAASGTRGLVLLTVPRKLEELLGQADAAALLSGRSPAGAELASLGPAIGLTELARGEIDRAEYSRRYGHRGPHEIEVSFPRPAEDPGWIDAALARAEGATHGADDLLARQEAARQAAWERVRQERPPKLAANVRKMSDRWSAVARDREAARSELVRAMWALRAWVLRAGELTGAGDDLFFLSYQEILDVLRGDRSPLSAVAARRASYQTYRALPPYPPMIRGRFDPVRWAADPGRRTRYYDEHASAAPPADRDGPITGFPGAAGTVEGIVRVIGDPEDAGQLGDGEILVTSVTNVGWTPVFPRAAAVVTDVGAPLSHAAIVARELGIPAVVGCGDATRRLHSGDRVRVDGGKGTVDVLGRNSAP